MFSDELPRPKPVVELGALPTGEGHTPIVERGTVLTEPARRSASNGGIRPA
jgi:hypothetical protein